MRVQGTDGFGHRAVAGVGAVFIAAIHLGQLAVLGDDLHHAGGIQAAAIAADKQFLFHLDFLRDAETQGRQAKPIGGNGLQVVTQQHIAGGDLPGVTVSVYINLEFLAV